MTSPPMIMKAAVLTGRGGPEMLEYRSDWPVPQPGPDEVLVKVGACGINNTDIVVREGGYGGEDGETGTDRWTGALPEPRIQGADIAGIIAAVGPGVDAGRVGERVMVDFGIYNDPGDSLANVDYIGHGRDGGFAEFVAVPAANAHAVETKLSDAELATFCCAYVTGERMLNRARVTAGERVLVTGASGGVGSGVVQLCRARGAIPYAVAGASKAAAVEALGAEAVIARDVDDVAAAAAAATGGASIDVVVDPVAGEMLGDLLAVLRPEGRYVTCGAIAGPMVELDLRTVYLKHLDILGSSQGTRAEFAAVRDYVVAGAVKPLLAATYKLSEIGQAQADFKAKKYVGKLVIVPD